MSEYLDLVFRARWPTLGHYMHYWVHRDLLAAKEYRPNWPLPEPASASVVAYGERPSRDYPDDKLVDAIDRRWGRYEHPDIHVREKLAPALTGLAAWSPGACEVINAACINGRVRLVTDYRVRHYSWGRARDIAAGMQDEDLAPELDAQRKLQGVLTRAWDLLGVLMATPEELEKARGYDAAARWAVRWASDRGLLGEA